MNSTLAKSTIIGAVVLWALLGAVSMLPAMFSVMMFDAPGSTNNPATLIVVASLMSFPFVCALVVVRTWRAYRSGELSLARRWAAAPLLNILLGGTACVWIEFFQRGRFAS